MDNFWESQAAPSVRAGPCPSHLLKCLHGHIPMFSFQVLKPSILPFPTAKEWKQTPGGLCVWPWGARVAAGTGVEPGAVCTEVGGSSF